MKALGTGLLLHIIAALIGLALFIVLASFMKWISPVWWGGNALFIPLIGAAVVAVASVPTTLAMYVLSQRERRRGKKITWPLLGYAGTGFLNGTLCLPVGFFGAAVTSQLDLPPMIGAAIALVVAAAASVVVFRPHVQSSGQHAS